MRSCCMECDKCKFQIEAVLVPLDGSIVSVSDLPAFFI